MEQEMINNISNFMMDSAITEAYNWADYEDIYELDYLPIWDYVGAVYDAMEKFHLDFYDVRNCFGWDEYTIVADQTVLEVAKKYKKTYNN